MNEIVHKTPEECDSCIYSKVDKFKGRERLECVLRKEYFIRVASYKNPKGEFDVMAEYMKLLNVNLDYRPYCRYTAYKDEDKDES